LVQAEPAPQALQLTGTILLLHLWQLQLAVVAVETVVVGNHLNRVDQVAVVLIPKQAQVVLLGKVMQVVMGHQVMVRVVVELEPLVQMHQEQAGRVVLVLLALFLALLLTTQAGVVVGVRQHQVVWVAVVLEVQPLVQTEQQTLAAAAVEVQTLVILAAQVAQVL
jgi:hypothetical protein